MNSTSSTSTLPQARSRSPWLYVPTAYFAEGLPYVIVNTVSTVLYKNLGVPNTLIGLTSLLYLPWVLKPLWGPTVDLLGTKRNWILWTQVLMALVLALVGTVLHLPAFFNLSLVLFVLV
ncbi:MAG: MFS transporter, partial [candidate division KSB1 bacterium]